MTPRPVSLWDIIVISGLLAWILATIAHSFGISGWLERKLGLLAQLLPGWNFFAPTPNTADYFLLYRDYYDSQHPTPWLEMRTLNPPRRRYAWLWNPEKIISKSFFDLVQALGLESRGIRPGSERLLQLSVPYLHLLSFVSHVPRWPVPWATQFMIMRRESRSQNGEVILVSAVHQTGSLESESPAKALNCVIGD